MGGDLPGLGLDAHAAVPLSERLRRVPELDTEIAAVIATLTRDEAVERLTAAGAPVAPALTRTEMMELEHFRARGVIAAGTVGSPVRTSAHPPLPPGPVAELDQHRYQGRLAARAAPGGTAAEADVTDG